MNVGGRAELPLIASRRRGRKRFGGQSSVRDMALEEFLKRR
jgi:hypothetical protein